MKVEKLINEAIQNIALLNKVKKENAWLETLAQKSFEERLASQLAAGDYSAKSTLAIFVELTKSSQTEAEWLDAIYQFTLSLSYPSNATIPPYQNVVENAYVFLELFRLICQVEKEKAENTFVYDYPFELLSKREIEELEDPTEYNIVVAAFRYDYIYEMMKLNREIFPYTSLEHITGVHYLAMFIARQVKASGIPVDLGIVSGAAALHDIGKFGCRPEESRKVAYYHYYYTEEWFYRKGIQYIRNIAVNHSTWDLELESLSIESLILIFSDFRVKEHRDPTLPYPMKFYTPEDSFNVILEKLDNVDAAKEKRYRKVYDKLADFKVFLQVQGIETSFDKASKTESDLTDPALLRGKAIVKRYKNLSISHSLALMYELRNQKSLLNYLNDIKNTSDILPMRRKMQILEQFSKYLTPEQKILVLDFLFELLILNEEGLRRQVAEIMGQIIISFDDPYSKYLPPSVESDIYKLSKSKILRQFVNRFLNPEVSRSRQKNRWIGIALSDLFRTVLTDSKMPTQTINLLLEQFDLLRGESRIYLLAALLHLPIEQLTAEQLSLLGEQLAKSLDSDRQEEVIYAALCVQHLLPTGNSEIIEMAKKIVEQTSDRFYVNFFKQKLAHELKEYSDISFVNSEIQLDSSLYLENLKSVTPQAVKALNIDFLLDYMIRYDNGDRFYFAVHLCNLIKNSEHYEIRLIAGDALLKLSDYLTAEKLNEVVIELLRGLEIENYQFTKNIPPILGRLIVKLPVGEQREVLEDFETKIRQASDSLKVAVVETVQHSIIASVLADSDENLRRLMISIVFKALVQSENICHIVAFNALTIGLLGTPLLDLRQKYQIFQKIAKKLLCIIANIAAVHDIDSVNYAYGYNKLYVFLSEYAHEIGDIEIPFRKKVAYFSGTFDPFSLGQCNVSKMMSEQGFDVYLAIDCFNWRRRTQPLELRRRLIEMTIADQPHVYTMPTLPALDLRCDSASEHLKTLFPDCDVYIVTGEDKLSERYFTKDDYQSTSDVNHLIIKRAGLTALHSTENKALLSRLKNVDYITIDDELSAITNDKIRYAIDQQWNIDDVVDQLAAEQIKKYNLYHNEPTYKLPATHITTTTISKDQVDDDLVAEIKAALHIDINKYLNRTEKSLSIMIIRDLQDDLVNSIGIYRELSNEEFDVIKDDPTIKTDYIDLYKANTIVIELLASRERKPLHNHLLSLHTDMIVQAINCGYDYCIYRHDNSNPDKTISRHLHLTGYRNIDSLGLMLSTIKAPVIVMLDAQSMLKQAFRQNEVIRHRLADSREKLLAAFVRRYPNSVILTFERAMLYHKINEIVVQQNVVSGQAETGPLMCVPYGDIYKRWVLPKSVTKALHTERVYDIGLRYFEVKKSPHYPLIEEQVAIIKAFNRPVMLIDDLVDKGLRLNALEDYLINYNVPIHAVVVGVMSDVGKKRATKKGYRIMAGYYIPNMRAWYSESHLYPFIGGDAYFSADDRPYDILPSVNKILPYMNYKIENTNRQAITQFSKTCLQQALMLVEAIEDQYNQNNRRPLTIERLNEVFVTPRVPYYGRKIKISRHSVPSDMIKNDLIRLEQIVALVE